MNNVEKIVLELQQKIDFTSNEINDFMEIRGKIKSCNYKTIDKKIFALNNKLIHYKEIREKIKTLFENNLTELIDTINLHFDEDLSSEEIYDMILNIDENQEGINKLIYQLKKRDIK